MLIIYQPYDQFLSAHREFYTRRPRVFGKLIPNKVKIEIETKLSSRRVSRIDEFCLRSIEQYKEKKKTFDRLKNIVINAPLFKLLKEELESYYGEENVDYSISPDIGKYAFCVYFDKLEISTEYAIKHEIRDTFFIIQCKCEYIAGSGYVGERISNLSIYRSSFFTHEQFRHERTSYFVHPHMRSSTYLALTHVPQILLSEGMCTGDVSNLASEIKTHTLKTDNQLKFISFVYHIRDLIQWENNANPYHHIKSLYEGLTPISENKNLIDFCYLLSEYSTLFQMIKTFENNRDDEDVQNIDEFELIFGNYFKEEPDHFGVTTNTTKYLLDMIQFRINSGFEISDINYDSLFAYLFSLHSFFTEMVEFFSDIYGHDLYADEPDIGSIINSSTWKSFYSYLNTKENVSISVAQYETLPDTLAVEETPDETVQVDFNRPVMTFKDKIFYLKKINTSANKSDIKMVKSDFVLQLNQNFLNNIKSNGDTYLNILSKTAATNTLFKEQKTVQTFARSYVYETSPGLGLY